MVALDAVGGLGTRRRGGSSRAWTTTPTCDRGLGRGVTGARRAMGHLRRRTGEPDPDDVAAAKPATRLVGRYGRVEPDRDPPDLPAIATWCMSRARALRGRGAHATAHVRPMCPHPARILGVLPSSSSTAPGSRRVRRHGLNRSGRQTSAVDRRGTGTVRVLGHTSVDSRQARRAAVDSPRRASGPVRRRRFRVAIGSYDVVRRLEAHEDECSRARAADPVAPGRHRLQQRGLPHADPAVHRRATRPREDPAGPGRRGANAPAGNFYAWEPSQHSAGRRRGVRVGLAPYTDRSDVERLVDGLMVLLREKVPRHGDLHPNRTTCKEPRPSAPPEGRPASSSPTCPTW